MTGRINRQPYRAALLRLARLAESLADEKEAVVEQALDSWVLPRAEKRLTLAREAVPWLRDIQ